jgi:hypothetical protein
MYGLKPVPFLGPEGAGKASFLGERSLGGFPRGLKPDLILLSLCTG